MGEKYGISDSRNTDHPIQKCRARPGVEVSATAWQHLLFALNFLIWKEGKGLPCWVVMEIRGKSCEVLTEHRIQDNSINVLQAGEGSRLLCLHPGLFPLVWMQTPQGKHFSPRCCPPPLSETSTAVASQQESSLLGFCLFDLGVFYLSCSLLHFST